MFRRIFAKKWGRIQQRYKANVRSMHELTATWLGEITHILLNFTYQMWKARCQYIHLLKDGTSESTYIIKMKKCESIKKDSWKLIKCDRHLLNRDKKYITFSWNEEK